MLPLNGAMTPTTSLIFLLIAGDCSSAMARKSVCPMHEMRICISSVHKEVCVRYKQNYARKQHQVKRGTRCRRGCADASQAAAQTAPRHFWALWSGRDGAECAPDPEPARHPPDLVIMIDDSVSSRKR